VFLSSFQGFLMDRKPLYFRFAKKRLATAHLFCLATSLLLLGSLTIGCASVNAQPSTIPIQNPTQTPNEFENNTVYIGIWLVNIYSYNYLTGSYVLDFYLYFFWVDPNINGTDWYLMNGYTVNPATTVLVDQNLTGPVKYTIYRVTAQFSSTPDASNFPFDKIELGVSVELLTHGYATELKWLENQTGIDPIFQNPGWVTTDLQLTVSNHEYPLDVTLPQAEMTITQQRQQSTIIVQYLFPPLIFSIVSAFSFLFSLKDMSAVSLRIGLNSSMLVTTLLFNYAVNSNFPQSSSTIVLYTVFMTAVLTFMVLNLLVTVFGLVRWSRFKNAVEIQRINRLGFIATIGVPLLIFVVLILLRG